MGLGWGTHATPSYVFFHGSEWLPAAEVMVPSVWNHMQRSCRIWQMARSALLCSMQNQRLVARQSLPAPAYVLGQDLPLRTDTHKWLSLAQVLKVHPSFHVSLLKPVSSSPLSPLAKPPLPPWLVDGNPCYAVRRSFIVDVTLHSDFYREFPKKAGRTLPACLPASLPACPLTSQAHPIMPPRPQTLWAKLEHCLLPLCIYVLTKTWQTTELQLRSNLVTVCVVEMRN